MNMYYKTFFMAESPPIMVSWDKRYTDVSIQQGAVLLGKFASLLEAEQGKTFVLPDGRSIRAVFERRMPCVWHDDKKLEADSAAITPNDGFFAAVKGLIWLGSAHLFFALVVGFKHWNMSTLQLGDTTMRLIISGVILLILGFWAKMTGSKTPFWIGIAFFALNMALILFAQSYSGLIISAVLIYYLYKGTQAEAPVPARKPFSDQNTPLDSDL